MMIAAISDATAQHITALIAVAIVALFSIAAAGSNVGKDF
jgi:hypothetical protein